MLNSNESWALFKRIGGEIWESPNQCNVASKIVESCGGLPLAIKAVASALKVNGWEGCVGEPKWDYLEPDVIGALQFSYNFLNNHSKEMFSLCCLFPEAADIYIQDLLKLRLGFGLFRNMTFTLDKEIPQTHVLVDHLKSSSLLLEGSNGECVKMRDFIHYPYCIER